MRASHSPGAVATFLRLRSPAPDARPVESRLEPSANGQNWCVTVPPDAPEAVCHRARGAPELRFRFKGVLDKHSEQTEVFDRVFAGCSSAALDGYNATLLAYGETGSGKTHSTIGPGACGVDGRTRRGGKARNGTDRGIIPRALEELYREKDRRNAHMGLRCRITVAFYEIHNERIYDLLLPREDGKEQRRQQVFLRDDGKGDKHLVNLRVFEAADEETAMRLLLRGCRNRETTATPMNEESSRSHAILRVTVETCEESDKASGPRSVQRVGKLTFVDLAGSERINKDNNYDPVGFGTLKRQSLKAERDMAAGRRINKSLAFLEQIVVALQRSGEGQEERPENDNYDDGDDGGDDDDDEDGAKVVAGKESQAHTVKVAHLPYRNSTLTAVLQDCLGRNSHTVLLVTALPEFGHIEETISTCLFAARCARVRTTVAVNAEADPQEEIEFLRGRVRNLTSKLKKRTEALKNLQVRFNAAHEALQAWDANAKRTLGVAEEVRCNELVSAMLRKEPWSADQIHIMTDICALRKLCELLLSQVDAKADAAARSSKEAASWAEQAELLTREVHSLHHRISMRNQTIVTGHAVHQQAAYEAQKRIENHDSGPPQLSLEAEDLQSSNGSAGEEIPPTPTPSNLTQEQINFIGRMGAPFRKHGRFGKPHGRYVWFSSDMKTVNWRDPAKPGQSTSLIVGDHFDYCLHGQSGQKIKGYRSSAVPEHCVALIGPKRALRLEVLSTQEILDQHYELQVPAENTDSNLLEALNMLRKSSQGEQCEIWSTVFQNALAQAGKRA